MKTHQQKLESQREYRKLTGNSCTNAYEKTPKGYLMRKYHNMHARVSGIQWRKAHLYKGLPILSREEFYAWAYDSREFWDLFDEYTLSGYDRKLAPSVNRIDSSKGYELDNMEWLTHSDNSRDGALSKRRAGILLPTTH